MSVFNTINLDPSLIESKMYELEDTVLKYHFNNIENLEKALYVEIIEDQKERSTKKERCNNSLATVGDSVLEIIVTDMLYFQGKNMEQITKETNDLTNNKVLTAILKKQPIHHYAFDDNYFFLDAPEHTRLPSSWKHTTYVEAIIAAVYYDAGFDKCKEWAMTVVLDWILTLTGRCKIIVENGA